MFWDSVLGGLSVLTFWETYVAGFEYLLIFLGPVLLMSLTMKEGGAAGCLSMLAIPVLHAIAVAVVVLTLAPIIFGFAKDAAWSFPWVIMGAAPGMFLKLIGILLLSAIALAFVPLLGQIQSFQTLVLGGIALIFDLGIFKTLYPEVSIENLDFIPGFWFTVGLLLLGGIMAWVGIVVSSMLAIIGGGNDDGIRQLLVFPIAAMFGFLPVFVYGAWIGNQLRQGF